MERVEMVVCPGCQDESFKVCAGEVCFDCAYPTKAMRQFAYDRLRWQATQNRETLRDRLAMAAFSEASTAAAEVIWSPHAVGHWSYRLADAMLEARGADAKPEPLLPETKVDAPK